MDADIGTTSDSGERREDLHLQYNQNIQAPPGFTGGPMPAGAHVPNPYPTFVNSVHYPAPPPKPKKSKKSKILIASIAGLVLIALAIAIGVVVYAGQPHTAEGWLELGDKYLLDMNYEKAFVSYSKAIQLEPKSIPARLGLAQVLMEASRYREAESVLFEVLELDDRNKDAIDLLLDLAKRLINRQMYPRAERLYRKMLEIDRLNPYIYMDFQDFYDLIEDYGQLEDLIEEMRRSGLDDYILFSLVVGKVVDGASDPSSPLPLSGVEITIKTDNRRTKNLRSGNDGTYSTYLRSGHSRQRAEKTGYIPFNREIDVLANETLYLAAIELTPTSENRGTISGLIIDSITGWGIPDAHIAIYDQEMNQITTTGSNYNGQYEFTGAAGYYRVHVNASGYMETQRDLALIGGQELYNRDLTMSPVLQDGEIRIVLTWGPYPYDLDSHLFGPSSSDYEYHIFFAEKTVYEDGYLTAFLDLDDIDSYGPETTTIYSVIEGGTYSFVVHDYTNRGSSSSAALANSGANVKVYMGNQSVREFHVPPNLSGDSWHVFDLVNGEIRTASASTWHEPVLPDFY